VGGQRIRDSILELHTMDGERKGGRDKEKEMGRRVLGAPMSFLWGLRPYCGGRGKKAVRRMTELSYLRVIEDKRGQITPIQLKQLGGARSKRNERRIEEARGRKGGHGKGKG